MKNLITILCLCSFLFSDSIEYLVEKQDRVDGNWFKYTDSKFIENITFHSSNGIDIFYLNGLKSDGIVSERNSGGIFIMLSGLIQFITSQYVEEMSIDDRKLLNILSIGSLMMGGFQIYTSDYTLNSIPCTYVVEILDTDGNQIEFECN